MKSDCFRIKELRIQAGLTQAALAFALELRSPSTVAMWEAGKRCPPSATLPRLAMELHCTIPDLYALDQTTAS